MSASPRFRLRRVASPGRVGAARRVRQRCGGRLRFVQGPLANGRQSVQIGCERSPSPHRGRNIMHDETIARPLAPARCPPTVSTTRRPSASRPESRCWRASWASRRAWASLQLASPTTGRGSTLARAYCPGAAQVSLPVRAQEGRPGNAFVAIRLQGHWFFIEHGTGMVSELSCLWRWFLNGFPSAGGAAPLLTLPRVPWRRSGLERNPVIVLVSTVPVFGPCSQAISWVWLRGGTFTLFKVQLITESVRVNRIYERDEIR